ncbi:MAG: FkbM family methyltransferase [bacterium]|nr:FkbM family methyltransferase [bacterium]
MFKKLVNILFKRSVAEKKLLLKDYFLANRTENIARAIQLIKKVGLDRDPDKFIIDVGAFDGETSIMLSRAFPRIQIISFEANEAVFKMATVNCKPFPLIHVFNFAISNKEELLPFFVTSNKVSSSLNSLNEQDDSVLDFKGQLQVEFKTEVPAKKLDHFTAGKNILLLKIDTQGHELKVLEGANETLKRTDLVLLEMSNHDIYKDGSKYFELDAQLRAQDFTLVDIIVSYRKNGIVMKEFDAIYAKKNLTSLLNT